MGGNGYKSIDPAALEMLKIAEEEGYETVFSRVEEIKPCPIGRDGACCKHCFMGPCRLVGKITRGICGATLDTVVARNLARAIAAGSAAHSDHGRDMALTLLAAAEGEAPDYRIRDLQKLLEIADIFGVPYKDRNEREIARDLALKVLAEFGQQKGELTYLKRAPLRRQEIWRKYEIAPRGIDREVVELMHRTVMGNDQDPEHLLLGAMRCALADGWGGSMLSTDITDILFGSPAPLKTRANLGALKEDEVNIVVHGHEPLFSEMMVLAVNDPELIEYARSKGAKGINLAGICCTANETLMRQGIPTVGNFLHQELAILTGAVDLMAVDIQCIMEALAPLAERFHTKLITTSPKVKVKGALHVEFDESRALEIAKQIVRMAIDNFPNRGKVRIPKQVSEVVAGFSHEYITYALGGYYRGSFRPLNDAIIHGRIRGVAGVVGCNNPHCTQDAAHEYIVKELIKNDVLVVQTGCGAIASAKYGLLLPETMEEVGPGLREICEAVGIPPVLHMGACVDNSRILTVASQMATEGGLGEDIADLPAVGIAPEWMSEKALAIGTYFAASGVYVMFGVGSPIKASAEVQRIMSEGWEKTVGGKLEFVEDPEEIVRRALEHIDKKRAALGLEEYNPAKFGKSGDRVMLQFLKALEEGREVSLYSAKSLAEA